MFQLFKICLFQPKDIKFDVNILPFPSVLRNLSEQDKSNWPKVYNCTANMIGLALRAYGTWDYIDWYYIQYARAISDVELTLSK